MLGLLPVLVAPVMADVTHVAITVGAGRTRPQGRRQVLSGSPSVAAVAETLDSLPATEDSWFSAHVWAGDYRLEVRWEYSWLVIHDFDYQDVKGEHSKPPAEAVAGFEQAAGTLPINIWLLIC